MSFTGDRFEEVKAALAPLVELGWVVARVELSSDEEDGTRVSVMLRYAPPVDTDVL